MQRQVNTRLSRGLFLDRDIERLRKQAGKFLPLLSRRKTSASLAALDLETEGLLSEIFGEASEVLETYEYAKLGEAASLVNMPEEAQESGAQDIERESLQQRKRVLESGISELEARRTGTNSGKKRTREGTGIQPRVADFMSHEVRSVHRDATLKEAARLLQKWKVGSLLVDDGSRYIGIITDTDLSRRGVGRGLDPTTTAIKSCMSKPIQSIEDDEPIQEAVKLMKEKGIRHLAVTEDSTIIGVLSVSDLLRYYSGVV